MQALTFDVSELGILTDEVLYRLCLANREIRFERTQHGEARCHVTHGRGNRTPQQLDQRCARELE